MPKLINRNPKLSKLKEYAVVYYRGKIHYLGRHGTPDALTAYNRFCAEIQANPVFFLSSGEKHVIVRELTAAFLDHAKANFTPTDYSFYRVIVLDFLDKLYGDETPVENFTPRCLKLVREDMVKSRRFCRNIVNRCVNCIISIFAWGVENELVLETTWRALKVVKSLPKGYPSTFDHDDREPVADNVVQQTLPFMPPTLRAMVQIQRLTGMRPSEVFRMRVGEIDRSRVHNTGLWYYTPGSHKTQKKTGKKTVFPLAEHEQALIEPYLINKAPEAAVFSPRTAMSERKAERRANRQTKITPLQAARDKERAAKPSRYSEFYNRDSYRNAIEHAIKKGNRQLSEEEKIPHWVPYQLRHAAITAISLQNGKDAAQALAGHTSSKMTDNYDHSQLQKREALARNRVNPFESGGSEL